jgi:ABC-type multidrug transport system, ATPase component
VLLSSHNMDVVEELCDRVVIMKQGSVIAADTVKALTDVFSTQTYELTLSSVPERDQRKALSEEFDAVAWGESESRRLTVTLGSADQLYDLMDRLREAGVVVESISAAEQDLEAAFVQMTEADGQQLEVGFA